MKRYWLNFWFKYKSTGTSTVLGGPPRFIGKTFRTQRLINIVVVCIILILFF